MLIKQTNIKCVDLNLGALQIDDGIKHSIYNQCCWLKEFCKNKLYKTVTLCPPVCKILKFRWHIKIKISANERRKRNVFSKPWKPRGERDMKINSSSSREKTKSHFSSRTSRDRDSFHGLDLATFRLCENIQKYPYRAGPCWNNCDGSLKLVYFNWRNQHFKSTLLYLLYPPQNTHPQNLEKTDKIKRCMVCS